MITIEHLNLVVKDLPASLHFFQTAFPDGVVRGEGQGEWYGKPRKWLHFGDQQAYLTLNDNGEEDIRDLIGHQIGLAHFAFVVNHLPRLIERMQQAGYEVSHKGESTSFRRNVYFVDPNGFEVEFVEYLSDIDSERNQYGAA